MLVLRSGYINGFGLTAFARTAPPKDLTDGPHAEYEHVESAIHTLLFVSNTLTVDDPR